MKPFVKRQKNDMTDAEAICEAPQRPTMRFTAVKSEAKQAAAVVFRVRDLLVGQRTQIINALRGHAAEYGLIASQGSSDVERLVAEVEDPASGIPNERDVAVAQQAEAFLAVMGADKDDALRGLPAAPCSKRTRHAPADPARSR